MTQAYQLPPLPPRRPDAHKGDFGRVLVVAGSQSMPGAAALTALAALRGGAGLVKVATPRSALPTVLSICPCATGIPLAETTHGMMSRTAARVVARAARDHDVVVAGPGIGVCATCLFVLETLLEEYDGPLLLDADALNNLAPQRNWWKGSPARLILSPHPGEMRRLLVGAKLDDDLDDRTAAARRLAALLEHVVLLKGAGTVVCDGRRYYINESGNPGMATAGAGDVLSGLLAALLAQGLDPFDAACLAAHLHGRAGDLAADSLGQTSLIATDLIDALPRAMCEHLAVR